MKKPRKVVELDVAHKKPRKGSFAYEAQRLGPVAAPVMHATDVAVRQGVTLKELLMLVRAGYRGAERRRGDS